MLGLTHTDNKEIAKKYAKKLQKIRIWDSLGSTKKKLELEAEGEDENT